MSRKKTGGDAHRAFRIEAPVDRAVLDRIDAVQRRYTAQLNLRRVPRRDVVLMLVLRGLDAVEAEKE